MGISGSVTSAVSSTSVTLPSDKLTIIGASVYAGTVAGYLSIPIDGSRNGIFPFTVPVDVTTVKVPNTQVMLHNGMWHFHFTPSGSTLNYVGVGLTSGTFVFYYGTPFGDSLPLESFAGIVTALTTETSDSITLPSGKVRILGFACTLGTTTTETNLQIRFSWNTGTGRSVLFTITQSSVLEVIGFGPDVDGGDGLAAAQTLTVTVAYSGTHVGTGYYVLYYKIAS